MFVGAQDEIVQFLNKVSVLPMCNPVWIILMVKLMKQFENGIFAGSTMSMFKDGLTNEDPRYMTFLLQRNRQRISLLMSYFGDVRYRRVHFSGL